LGNALQQWLTGLRRVLAGPKSLERSIALTVGGLLLAAILLLAVSAVSLLRKQAEQQALGRVQLAGAAAREQIRRLGEDALANARASAARPVLQRLLVDGDRAQLALVLRRACATSAMSDCAVVSDAAGVVAATRSDIDWLRLLRSTAEQGERFMFAPPDVPDGLQGAYARVSDSGDARLVVVRRLDARLARQLTDAAGMEVRLVPLTQYLDNVEPALRALHSSALSSEAGIAQRIAPLGIYASSTPLIAPTGEGVALIEARLPVSGVDAAVDGFVRRLGWTACVLSLLAVAAALLLARRIVGPLQTLADSAARLGRGDFSASIPVAGGPETAALSGTLEDMRRNLVELTATLRQREAEAQAMLRGVVEGVFAVDANRTLRYLNPQAEQMLGVSGVEALGRFCGDVLRPLCDAKGNRPCDLNCPILAARERSHGQSTEFLQRTSGSTRTVIITSAPMVDGLQVQVMRDETELESVRRARDSILANISHEFRTPLAAQLASLELLQDNLPGMPREQVQELVGSLQRSTLRLTRLIDNLLESVRIESGQLGIRAQRVELSAVVEDAAEMVSGLLTQRGQRLAVALPAALPAVTGDATRLTQVFVNLLANANKFGPQVSVIHVAGAALAGQVQVWVEDEGPGMPAADTAVIFERYYRAADAEPEPRGLGLGLWIVKSIIERHGGQVAAVRTPQHRTRFTITLPAEGSVA